jgi:hypothetical protein
VNRRLAWGLAVGAVFLFLAQRGTSLAGVWDALRATRPLLVALGLGFGFATCAVMGLRWRTVLAPTAPMSARDAIDQVTIANLATLVMPARAGDVARVALVRLRWNVPATHALGAIVLERLSDVLVLVALASAITTAIVLPLTIRIGLLTIGGSAVVALVGLWAWVWRGAQVSGTLLARLPDRFAGTAGLIVSRVTDGLQAMRRPRQFACVIALSALVWALSGLTITSYIFAFRLPVPWYAGLVVLTLTNLGGIVPVSPGAIGVYHYLSVLAVSFWITDRSAALGFAVVTHALLLLVTAVAGIFGLARQGLSLRRLERRVAGFDVSA